MDVDREIKLARNRIHRKINKQAEEMEDKLDVRIRLFQVEFSDFNLTTRLHPNLHPFVEKTIDLLVAVTKVAVMMDVLPHIIEPVEDEVPEMQ